MSTLLLSPNNPSNEHSSFYDITILHHSGETRSNAVELYSTYKLLAAILAYMVYIYYSTVYSERMPSHKNFCNL